MKKITNLILLAVSRALCARGHRYIEVRHTSKGVPPVYICGRHGCGDKKNT